MKKKIFYLISKAYYRLFFTVLALIFFATIIEVFSLGLIVPLMYSIITPEIFDNSIFWNNFFNFFGISEHNNKINFFLLLLVTFFIFKTFFLIFVSKMTNNFVAKVQSSLSIRLYRNYLNLSYSEFFKKNSSNLLKNIIHEVQYFSILCVLPLLMLAAEFFILLGISTLLLTLAFQEASISFLSLFLPTLFFYFFVKKKILKLGSDRENFDKNRYQFVQESLGAFKSIKLLGKENFFSQKYSKDNLNSAFAEAQIRFLISVPRLLLEFFAVLFFSFVIFFYASTENDFNSILPLIVLFGASVFRLLPSFNRIISHLTSIKSSEPVINTLYKEFFLESNQQTDTQINSKIIDTMDSSIEINNLNFSHQDSDNIIFDNLNLIIKKNSYVSILGESGRGKSTLLDLIMGILNPKHGSIFYDNKNISDYQINHKKLIGYVPQSIYLIDGSIKENIALGINEDEINIDRINNVLRITKLFDHIYQLKDNIESNVGDNGAKLSGGQIQRIGIARALYNDPEILILDEATSALDENTEENIIKEIFSKNLEKTVIFVTHRKSIVKYCDISYEIKNKKLIEVK